MLRARGCALVIGCAAAVGAAHSPLRVVHARPAIVRATRALRMASDDAEQDPGHAPPAGAAPAELPEEEMAMQKKVAAHQKKAARLSSAEEARSLIAYSTGFGVLSTMSESLPGFPAGAVVGFAPDADGLPVFCFSTMSSHTTDLNAGQPAGAAAALTVTAAGFKGAADGRVSLTGVVKRIEAEEEIASMRELYRAKHESAFWVDFGDFSWYRMAELKTVRFIGGFARAGQVSAKQYLGAAVDPIQAFAAPVVRPPRARRTRTRQQVARPLTRRRSRCR